MTIQQAYQQLLTQLYEVYDDREAANISDWVMEHVTGRRRIDRMMQKEYELPAQQLDMLQQYAQQLLLHTPVQYVLHEAWFAGMQLYVDENVLIPRPETEELVEWVVHSLAPNTVPLLQLVDIGTGSGCIPIAIKKKLPALTVHALDVSAAALNVAQRNAAAQLTPVHFHEADILNEATWSSLPVVDVIVSNPPYIRRSEAAHMQQNVLAHEPHLALFVADDDPLLFYRQIAAFGRQHLAHNGLLFFEINEALGRETVSLLEQQGYTSVELKKDMQGKDRMIKAVISR